MIGRFALIAGREVARAWRGGGLWPPVAFFLMVAILFPFGVGPDKLLLAKTGSGVAWMAALLAALLPVERLVEPDRADGTLDQLAVRGLSDETVAAAKIAGHWLGFAPPLLLATLPAAALLGLDGRALGVLLAGLAIGTPALASLGVTAAALTAGIRGAGAVAGLIVLPLAVPVLIFGASAAARGPEALKLLGAASLVLTALGPFAAGAALRATRS